VRDDDDVFPGGEEWEEELLSDVLRVEGCRGGASVGGIERGNGRVNGGISFFLEQSSYFVEAGGVGEATCEEDDGGEGGGHGVVGSV
jgi:hypothetical protein